MPFSTDGTPILSPTPRHRKPSPSRSPVREARAAAWQAASRSLPAQVAGAGRAAKAGAHVWD